MNASTLRAYRAVKAEASTGVANPLNKAPTATTGIINSHLARHIACLAAFQS
jgi:hypothetical protein